MAKIKGVFAGLDKKVDNVINDVLLEFANKMLEAIPSKLRGSFTLTVQNRRVTLWTDNEIAAYIEFGTGQFAKSYLSGQPDIVKDEAIQFFKTGTGTMPDNPYLFPAFFRWKDWAINEIDKRIQAVFDKL